MKKCKKIFMVLLVLSISVFSVNMIFADINTIQKGDLYLMSEIKTPVSAKDCKNKQYAIVEGYFKDAGFTNIELTKVLNDGFFPKEGKVAEVTLNGSKDFKKAEKYSSNSKIRITYYVDSEEELQETKNQVSETNNNSDEEFVPVKINNNKDLMGTWIQTNASDNVSYYAEIDEDTITIFSYFEDDDSTELYWTGTFNSNIDTKKKNEIKSENYRFITDSFDYASHTNNKIFTYEDSKISYDSMYLGVKENVILEKDPEDWAQTIKLTGDRQEGYNINTNNKVRVGGLEISYPYYYDSKDETSKDNDILFYPSDNTAYSNFEIVHTILDEKVDKELMLDVAYEALNDPEAKTQVLDQEEITVDGVDGVKTLYSTQDGIGINGMLFVNNGLEVVFVDVSFSYNDRSKNNYIKDFDNIIMNIKQAGKGA